MTTQPCPSCARLATTVVANMSLDPNVTYYRCDLCGHVWVTFADGSAVHHVTPLKDVERAS